MDQTILNWIFVGFGALIGFTLNSIWQATKDLQAADKLLAEKMSEIETLVAGKYLLRTEFNDSLRDVFVLLHRIEDKLDRKVDK